MKYDPIKNRFSSIIQDSTFFKIIFYKLLGIFFLREWYIKKAIKQEFAKQKPNNILDAGCGFGQYTYFMSKQSPRSAIDAVDLNPEHISRLTSFVNKMKLPISVYLQDLTLLDMKGKFQFVLCVDVMEHIENDRDVFKNFYNCLTTGGKLLISTPSDQGGSDTHDHDHEEGAHGFVDEHARDGYSKEDISEKLTSAGFSVEEIKYTYGTAGNISWRLAIKYPILLLNFSMIFVILLPFYYLITIFPILFLHKLDTLISWKTGTGLFVLAKKH